MSPRAAASGSAIIPHVAGLARAGGRAAPGYRADGRLDHSELSLSRSTRTSVDDDDRRRATTPPAITTISGRECRRGGPRPRRQRVRARVLRPASESRSGSRPRGSRTPGPRRSACARRPSPLRRAGVGANGEAGADLPLPRSAVRAEGAPASRRRLPIALLLAVAAKSAAKAGWAAALAARRATPRSVTFFIDCLPSTRVGPDRSDRNAIMLSKAITAPRRRPATIAIAADDQQDLARS